MGDVNVVWVRLGLDRLRNHIGVRGDAGGEGRWRIVVATVATDFLDVFVFFDVDDIGAIFAAAVVGVVKILLFRARLALLIVARPRTLGQGFGAPVGGGFKLGFGGRFFIDQGLPVSDRDLVVIWMDFIEGQEAVAIAAVVNEGGLERGLHPGDFSEIDIAAQKFPGGTFEVEFLYPAVALYHDPSFLRVGGIDEHFAV